MSLRAMSSVPGTAGPSARPAAADLRALVAEGGVGERLQRLVQVAELVRDDRQLLARLLALVHPCELLDEAVEAREERFELAVGDLLRVHVTQCSSVSAASA